MRFPKYKIDALQPYAKHLLEHGFATLPFQTRGFEQTAQLFENLLMTESAAYIQSWEVDLLNDHDPDDGIVVRDDDAHDKKTFFHYRPHLPDELRKRHVDTRRHHDLLEAALWQHYLCIMHMRLLACALHREIPEYHLREYFLNPRFWQRSVLRYLWYKSIGTQKGDELAKKHFDRGCLTFHNWERFPGLEIEQGEHYVPYTAKENTILAFWGQKAEKLSNGRFEKLYHRVTNRDGESSETARMSCVFFGHIVL